jgi:hypothetical protein
MSAETASDCITVLRTFGRLLATKTVVVADDGTLWVRPYDEAKNFEGELIRVAGIVDLATAIARISADRQAFLIRGEPLESTDLRRCRRLAYEDCETGDPACFREAPRRWLLLDFDSVERPFTFNPMDGELGATYLRSLLPPCFHDRSCWWSFTSSAGFSPGLRMRLAFWLDRPVGEPELKRLLGGYPVDASLFRPVQPIYVAPPIIRGAADPIRRRSGFLEDWHDTVVVPEIPEPEPAPVPVLPPHSRPPRFTDAWARLEAAAAKVAASPSAGTNPYGGTGRHHALFCAGLALSTAVKAGRLARTEVDEVLLHAAARVGLNSSKDVLPHITRGLREDGAA